MEFSQAGVVNLHGAPGVAAFNDSLYIFGGSDLIIARVDLLPSVGLTPIQSLQSVLHGSCAIAILTGEMFLIGKRHLVIK
jgi:hypothetical protein